MAFDGDEWWRKYHSMKCSPLLPTTCHFCQAPLIRRKCKTGMSFCGFDCKAQWQRTQKPVTREWLVEHYINQQLDTSEIGKMVKRDPKSVWNWLKDFDIPTRGRGADKRQHFKKGAPNPFLGRHHSPETRAKMSAHAKATGRVPYDPKIGSYMKGRKGPDTPSWRGGITPQRQAVMASLPWKRAVVKVWRRDKATCQRCGKLKKDHRSLPFDIHHIKSFQFKHLRCRVSNLVLLCEPCHYWIHSKKNTTNLLICR